jgi:hypothetical protein
VERRPFGVSVGDDDHARLTAGARLRKADRQSIPDRATSDNPHFSHVSPAR